MTGHVKTLWFGKAFEHKKERDSVRGYDLKFPPPQFALRKPGQRRKDHGARKREAEWRAYQGLWQRPINNVVCTADAFYELRRNVLGLNRKQAARLLRVSVHSVLNWERGVHPVPFPAHLALLLVSESLHHRREVLP